jgi:hypothetical protein
MLLINIFIDMKYNIQIAQRMLKYYDLQNPIVENCQLDKEVQAFFSFDDGTIEICTSRLENEYEFKKALLHEIKHAIDAKRMSLQKFDEAYNNEFDRLDTLQRDGYWDNPYEVKAEKFAEREIRYWT